MYWTEPQKPIEFNDVFAVNQRLSVFRKGNGRSDFPTLLIHYIRASKVFSLFNTPLARPFSTTTTNVTSQADLLLALLGST